MAIGAWPAGLARVGEMGSEVAVLMSVYNGEPYVTEAIDSILAQTRRDFEFVIVDDGSTDGTAAKLSRYAAADARVRIIRNDRNLGLPRSLNRGLAQIEAEFVARMDADDVALPQRLDRQLEFMRDHGEIGACGSWVKVVGDLGAAVWQYAEHDALIRCRLLFESALAHPSVVMRTAIVKAVGGYDPEFMTAQDYDLWVRLAAVTKLANIQKVLLLRRVHVGQKSRKERAIGAVQEATQAVRWRQLCEVGVRPDHSEMQVHLALSQWELGPSRYVVGQAAQWLSRIWAANEQSGIYERTALAGVLAQRLCFACLTNPSQGLEAFRTYRKAPFVLVAQVPARQWLDLVRRALQWKLRNLVSRR